MNTEELKRKYRKEHNKYVLCTTKSGMPIKEGSYSDEYVKWLEDSLIEKQSLIDSIQADIRNKLSPTKNLCAMLRDTTDKISEVESINNMIFKEIKNVEDNVDYLSNL